MMTVVVATSRSSALDNFNNQLFFYVVGFPRSRSFEFPRNPVPCILRNMRQVTNERP